MDLIQGQGESRAWVKKVQKEALEFAVRATREFRTVMSECGKLMPKNDEFNRAEVVNTMIDVLVGLTVSMGVAFCGDDIRFEEAVVQNIRFKFREMRKAKIMGKMVDPASTDDEEPA